MSATATLEAPGPARPAHPVRTARLPSPSLAQAGRLLSLTRALREHVAARDVADLAVAPWPTVIGAAARDASGVAAALGGAGEGGRLPTTDPRLLVGALARAEQDLAGALVARPVTPAPTSARPHATASEPIRVADAVHRAEDRLLRAVLAAGAKT